MCETQVAYKASVREEALARLYFLVEQRRRVGLLLGGADTSRSLLLRTFAGVMRQSGRQAVMVSLLGLDADEFLGKIAARLGTATNSVTAGQSDHCQLGRWKLWQRLSDRLIANRLDQQDTVLLLDDADMAQADVLRQVVRLAQFDTRYDTRLTLIVSADRSRIDKLGDRLIDLAALNIELDAQHDITADRPIVTRHE